MLCLSELGALGSMTLTRGTLSRLLIWRALHPTAFPPDGVLCAQSETHGSAKGNPLVHTGGSHCGLILQRSEICSINDRCR